MARPPERIDLILGEIRRIWNHNPDLRLTQLIHNTLPLEVTHAGVTRIYNFEDDALLAGLLNYSKET